MHLEVDPPKRVKNLKKHGFDLAEVSIEFFADALVLPGHSGRYRAVGEFEGRIIVVVVFRPLGTEALSLISMRPASRKERTQYAAR